MDVELHAVLSCEAVRSWWRKYKHVPDRLELTPNHQVGINKKIKRSNLGTKGQVHGPGFPWSWGLWCCVRRRCGDESGCVWAQPDTSELWMKLVHWLELQPPHTCRGRRTGQRCSQHQPAPLGVHGREICRGLLLSWWNTINLSVFGNLETEEKKQIITRKEFKR